jgi:hypothetical protein
MRDCGLPAVAIQLGLHGASRSLQTDAMDQLDPGDHDRGPISAPRRAARHTSRFLEKCSRCVASHSAETVSRTRRGGLYGGVVT